MSIIRPAAVAGAFYPDRPGDLQALLAHCWDDARITVGPVPKAIVAPHAGYIYSGAVAASAYARIRPAHGRIKRVILLGPCHRVAVDGLALSGADAFATPLGPVEIDKEAAALIADLPQVQVFDATHAQEHSLEVHLPFLMAVLDDFKVLPLVVGQATADQVAEVLDRLWGGPETLIVVSSDLSHYLDYDSARAIDRRTCRAIEALAPEQISSHGACGRFPLGGLLKLAKARGMTVETVDLRNSGDTAGRQCLCRRVPRSALSQTGGGGIAGGHPVHFRAQPPGTHDRPRRGGPAGPAAPRHRRAGHRRRRQARPVPAIRLGPAARQAGIPDASEAQGRHGRKSLVIHLHGAAIRRRRGPIRRPAHRFPALARPTVIVCAAVG